MDTDEGTYRAVWAPKNKERGTLILEARKIIHYSPDADVFPGMSTLLNLLAPAVTSMLMNHLTFDGPRSYFTARKGHKRSLRSSRTNAREDAA